VLIRGPLWWVDVQYFLNALFMILINWAGTQILVDHACLYWTRHSMPGRDPDGGLCYDAHPIEQMRNQLPARVTTAPISAATVTWPARQPTICSKRSPERTRACR
jgi:hypothetical protein